MSIPNTLTIFINTRIPGYQKLKFKPSMTIPTNTSETVYFDPLVKISRGSISNVPEDANPGKYDDLAKSQFFDKGMFQTLVNRNLSSIFNSTKVGLPTDTDSTKIEKAKEAGIIDNNIKVTLRTLFRPNSVIYIGNKPYTIYSYHWDKGDWKVNTKMLSPFTQPTSIYNRGQTINVFAGPTSGYSTGRYQQAQTELKQLSNKATEGDNFDPDKYKTAPAGVIGNGPASPPLLLPGPTPVPSAPLLLEAPPAAAVAKPLLLGAPTVPVAKPLLLGAPTVPVAKPLLLGAPPAAAKPLLIGSPVSSSSSTSSVALTPVASTPKLIEPGSAPTSTALATAPIPTARLITDDATTPTVGGGPESNLPIENVQQQNIRDYFNSYYDLLKKIYETNPSKFKNYVYPPPVKRPGKQIDTTTLSKTFYEGSVEELRVVRTLRDGNCFFTCIAKALNIYHDIPQNDEYQHTQKDIREKVQKYYRAHPETLKYILEVVTIPVKDEMNKELEKFRENNPSILGHQFDMEVDRIFNENGLMFIQKPKKFLGDFTVLSEEEALDFIMEPTCWADDTIYPIIQFIYGMKVIAINYENGMYTIPYPDLKPNTDMQQHNPEHFDKYVFLLFSLKHYDLITFFNDYPKRPQYLGETKPVAVFRRSGLIPDLNTPPNTVGFEQPPSYILFFIYGTFYSNIPIDEPHDVVLFEPQMKEIDEAVKDIYDNEKIRTEFKIGFDKVFHKGIYKSRNPTLPIPKVEPDSKSVPEPIPGEETVSGVAEPGATGVAEPGATGVAEPGATASGVAEPGATASGAPGATASGPDSRPTPTSLGLASGTKTNSMTTAFFGNSNLGFYIVVDLELYPGTSIPINKKFSIACDIQKEKIKESLAELRGKVYAPTPLNELYSNSPEMSKFKPVDTYSKKSTRGGKRPVNKTQKNKNQKNKNQKTRKTRKFGRRKYKTIKHRK